MKILHTSDLHLGKNLYDMPRYDEYQKLLDFIIKTIIDFKIEVLLLCGDIFDTKTPSHKSQELYYNFLTKLNSIKSLDNVVIISGNHDSPSFLDAAKILLKTLRIHIISNASDNIQDEVFILKDKNGKEKLVVGAVPYLRSSDLITSSFTEDMQSRNNNLRLAIKQHYENIGYECQKASQKFDPPLPIIGTGHLFLGGNTQLQNNDDNIYVGSLDLMPASIIPSCFKYTALGHIHRPQKIDNNDYIRYCGSPLQLSFDEDNSKKFINIVEITDTTTVTAIEVPVFQKIKSLKGDAKALLDEVSLLVKNNENIFLELNYESDSPIGDLYDKVIAITNKSLVKVLALKDRSIKSQVLKREFKEEDLSALTPYDVFNRLLDTQKIPLEEKYEYINTFKEIMNLLNNENDA